MTSKMQLERYGIEAKKSLGQNFIHDVNILEKIVAAAEVTTADTVLEIGPGMGALTEVLARHAGQVIAVELDQRMEPILHERLAAFQNISYLFQDILETHLARVLPTDNFVVVANVPYYITSAILRHLLENTPRPRRIVMTVQLEVAERLVAKPDDMSILSVSAQFYAKPRLVMRLSPGVFYPRPDVTSAVVRLDTYPQPIVSVPDESTFFRIVKAGFGQKRKQLKNSLAEGLHLEGEIVTGWLEAVGIDPRRRAETLTLAEWGALATRIPTA
jgi:16S rRNA (adenine1518-N6/adenine1519-N6)-dimethyltransferase